MTVEEMTPAKIIARQIMEHDTCGYTVDGNRVTCDDPVCDGLEDPYGKPMRYAECACNSRSASILAALDAAGFVIAPKEPNDEMIVAGLESLRSNSGYLAIDRDPLFVYLDMIHARPK